MAPSTAFIAPTLQTLHKIPPRQHYHHLPTCAAAPPPSPPGSSTPGDQFSQYAERNDEALRAEAARARSARMLQRHHHIFLHSPAESAFRAAVARYIRAQRDASDTTSPRLWVLRSTADPTFGTLRGEPFPPRAALLEDFIASAENNSVARWVAALDRAGRVLSPMESHYVDWAVCAMCASPGVDRRVVQESQLVAFEVLNADWAGVSSVSKMRDKLVHYANYVVGEGNISMYEVLQSIDEPTCFKTIEVYPSMDALRRHMNTADPPFEENMMECRAAVNRVRQLYSPLFARHT